MLQYEKVTKVEGHKCNLSQQDDLLGLYIFGGVFVNFRRQLRHFLMVSASNPDTRSFLKSSAQIRMEESRHLRNYYYMIHPFSEGRVFWETLMIVIYVCVFIVMPLEFAIPLKMPFVFYLKICCDIMFMIDIILFFCTGYYSVEHRKVVMNPWKVCKHYLFTYFIFDLISSLPYRVVIELSEKTDLRRLHYFFIFKLARLPTFVRYIEKFCIRIEIWSYKLNRMHFFLCVTVLIWWSTAGVLTIYITVNGYTLAYFMENPDLFTPMMDCCYQVVKSFVLHTTSAIYLDALLPLFFNIYCLLMGAVLNMIIIGQVLQIYQSRAGTQNKYGYLIQQIDEYMHYKEMPTSLKKRVMKYVDFKFQKNIFSEGDIVLSRLLKEDVVIHNCKRLVERVEFFQGLPDSFILRIMKKLKTEVYLPNDIIVQAGVLGNAMYFIYVGTVAVFTISGKEICHLDDGANFGEISLLINEPRVATVIAVTNCELFRLSRKDFLEALEPYPLLHGKIKSSALMRLNSTKMVLYRESIDGGNLNVPIHT